MKIIWFFFSLCLLVGCKRSDVAVSVEQTLPVIDLNAAYPEKKLDLAEVASQYLLQFQRRGLKR